jgi:hypothetical protein
MRVTRSRELVAEGYRPAAVARVAQISRQAIYRIPKPVTAKVQASTAKQRPANTKSRPAHSSRRRFLSFVRC